MKTVQQIVLNRDNFKFEFGVWLKHYYKNLFCSCCGKGSSRTGQLFEKGRRKVRLDLDLRTYIKNIRNVQIMQNVLMSEKQRNLMNFQQAKVLESGSTSGSDDRHYEPSIALGKTKTKLYKKVFHTD